jgi:RNA polymerase sigma factor (sigma-70 family)
VWPARTPWDEIAESDRFACAKWPNMEPASHAGNSKRFAVASPASTARLEALVCATARGDQTAFSALYEQTVGQVFSIARCLLRNKEDAEEIVCDVYTFAWQRAQAYDSTRGSVMAWLSVMTRNRAVDRLRQRRETVSLDDERHEALSRSLHADTLGPEQILAQFQAGSAVHQALSALSEKRRQLIGLAFFQGMTHEEIAAVVGMPLGTVKSHVRRALAVLQGELSAQT